MYSFHYLQQFIIIEVSLRGCMKHIPLHTSHGNGGFRLIHANLILKLYERMVAWKIVCSFFTRHKLYKLHNFVRRRRSQMTSTLTFQHMSSITLRFVVKNFV